MKTRTLLLLSVATALMILLAGGALLFQLSTQESASPSIPLGAVARTGDAEVTVVAATQAGDTLTVAIEVGGVDDPEGIDSFRLITGDRRLAPLAAGGERCDGITEVVQSCVVEFDVGASDGTNRVLVMRRGEDQSTWRLG